MQRSIKIGLELAIHSSVPLSSRALKALLLAEQDAKSPRYKETIYSGLQQRYLAMGAAG
jgi:hypothetical protein